MRKSFLLSVFSLFIFILTPAQEKTRSNMPEEGFVREIRELPADQRKQEAERFALEHGLPVRTVNEDGSILEIQRLSATGMPIYNKTMNLNAAKTVSANRVWAGGEAGLMLDGSGVVVGIWDGGKTRTSHGEFEGRARQVDNASDLSGHATHVSGTVAAGGLRPDARGMAYGSRLDCYDWSNDDAEMSSAAGAGLLLSNHSYGFAQGFEWSAERSRWEWWGDPSVSGKEDYRFGFYSQEARAWDQILYDNPKYLLVKSAGNDRSDRISPGSEHYIWDNGGWRRSTEQRENDGGSDGYDCLGSRSTTKNAMVVGAVLDIPDGYQAVSDVVISDFSSFGPTDDGRIKPDIVGNGVSLYSTYSSSDNSYSNLSGTSMSSPSVTGSMALLQQHHKSLFASEMYAAQLKALVFHTADEAGRPGPDYVYGWGLMNTASAAAFLSQANEDNFTYRTLEDSQTEQITFFCRGGEDIRVTMVWTDPAGTVPQTSLNPTNRILVNDLDLRVIRQIDNQVAFPWVLDPASPAKNATGGDNLLDNSEQIVIRDPMPGFYTLRVSHKGNLVGERQDYALAVSGLNMDYVASGFNEINDNNGDLLLTSADAYLDNMDVQWLLEPENAQPVSLYFSQFETEELEDVLRIYDGTDEQAPLLAELSGILSKQDTLIQSSGAALFLSFSSNEENTAPGFVGRFCTVAPEGEFRIQGEAFPCQNSSESYFAMGQAGTEFRWTSGSDWTLIPKSFNGIDVEIGTGQDLLSLSPYNRCGIGQDAALVLAPLDRVPVVDSILGDDTPCAFTTAVLTVSKEAGASYQWTYPQDWSGTQVGDTAWVKVNNVGGLVEVLPFNACGNGQPVTQQLTVLNPPAQTAILAEKIPPCAFSTQRFFVKALPDHSYQWDISGDWSILGEDQGDTVLVSVGESQTFVFVDVENTCGVTESNRLFLTSPPPPAAMITDQNDENGETELRIVNTDQFSDHRWFRNASLIEGSEGVNPLRVNINGTYTVETVSADGCNYLMDEGEAFILEEEEMVLRAWASDRNELSVENSSDEPLDFELVDLYGKVLMIQTAEPGLNTYHRPAVPGVYILRIKEGKQETKLLLY